MDNRWILVMDSGEGGVYTLNRIRAVLQCENYIMFKDFANAPYGNKSAKKLEQIATENIQKLTKLYDVKLIVLACNTLSAVVYQKLIKKFPDYIILPIVPDIQHALENEKPTLVLCTQTTLKHSAVCNYYRSKKLQNLSFYGFQTLAKKIDQNLNHLDELIPYLQTKLKKSRNKVENVVLGCTHFNLIKPQLCIALNNPNLSFFENSETLAQNVKEILLSFALENDNTQSGDLITLESE